MTSAQEKPSATMAATPGRERSICSVCCRRLIRATILVPSPAPALMQGCSEGASRLTSAERHRPGKGAHHLDYLEAAGEKPHELAVRPVVEMAGGIAEVADVGEPSQVEHPPERLARHAGDQPGSGEAGEHLQRPSRITEMLQDLTADHELGRVPLGPQLLDGGRLEVDRDAGGRCPPARLLQNLREGVAPADAQAAAREAYGQLSLTAADLVRLGGAAALHEPIEPAKEAHHQPARDWIGGSVLVVDVPAGLG